jgi:hypothetical protein
MIELQYCHSFLNSAQERLRFLEQICIEIKLVRAYLKEYEERISKEQGETIVDKQINKVKRDVKSGEKNLKKGEKDIKKLLRMDKKFDAKLEKCGAMKGKKK